MRSREETLEDDVHRFVVLNESGRFVSAVHSMVGRAKVVAGVENWKQELERTPDEYDGNFGG